LLLPSIATAAGSVRADRPAVSLHLDLGKSSGDPAGQINVEGEYNFFEHLSTGLGYAYVDGSGLQESCLELFVKGYLLGRSLDLFALAAAQFYLDESETLDSFFTLKAGIEWATPWKIFLGAEGAAFFEPAGIAYMGGAFLGLRL